MHDRKQVELALRRWLRQHHSVIGWREARVIGASAAVIRAKHDRGEWRRPYHGVYCDTAAPQTPYQDLRAACVATAGSVASHASAAWLWGLLPQPPAVPQLSVVRRNHDVRGPAAVDVHRSGDLAEARVAERNAIPVTNPLRTLVDLAGVAPPRELTDAVDIALSKRLVTVVGLEAEIARLARRGRPGVAVLRSHLLERGFTGAPAPSVLEAHTRRLIIGTGLPLPTIELRAGEDGQYRLDVAWAAILFAIEVDGYAWHWSPEQKARDEARRNALQNQGWTLRVYTWTDVLRRPDRMAREVIETYRRLSRPG